MVPLVLRSRISMKGIIFLFIAGTVFFKADLHAAPILSVEEKIDLGQVSSGKVLQKEFSVTNTGDSDLVLRSVSSSCECVRIISPKKAVRLKPGENLSIKISVDPTGYIGKVTKSIYLATNDPQNLLRRINISFEVAIEKKEIGERFKNFSLSVIISAGLIDGINPCAFSVMVFFISFLAFRGFRRRYLIFAGLSFLVGVFICYILLGLGIFALIQQLAVFSLVSTVLYLFIAATAIILGAISLWDYFLYRKTGDLSRMKLKLPLAVKNKVHKTIREDFSSEGKFAGALVLISTGLFCGFVVSILESLCTGQTYLPTIAYIFKNTTLRPQALFLLLLYNFCFTIPLIAVFLLALMGFKADNFAEFMRKNIGWVKIITALVFFGLGVGLIILKFYGA